jgi:hypothetical protein
VPTFCVNTEAQPDSGKHEVHDMESEAGCLPAPGLQHDLGWHPSGAVALRKAKKTYADANGCATCVPAIHT